MKAKHFALVVIAMILILAFLGTHSKAQGFIGVQLNSYGAGLHGGYQSELPHNNAVLLTVGWNHHFFDNEKPSMYYATAGYMYSFTEQDSYNITVNAGFAKTSYQDFTKYNADETGHTDIEVIKGYSGLYNIELGKDMLITGDVGRVFINATYCMGMSYGAGMKIIF